MKEKELIEKLVTAIDALNTKVDNLQAQVNGKKTASNSFKQAKPTSKQKDKKLIKSEFDKNLYAATDKRYGDESFKKALKYFNDINEDQTNPLSLKQLEWITYYAGQNHPECKTEVENFLCNELNRRADFNATKQDLINGIKEKYGKYQSHTDYYKAVLSWLEDL